MKDNALIVISILILGLTLFNTSKLNNTTMDDNFFDQMRVNLASKEQLTKYGDQYPRITYITGDMVENLRTNEFFNDVGEGDLLLEYQGATVLYDYNGDAVKNIQEFDLIPADILEKFTANERYKSYTGVTPAIVKITNANLENLKTQISGLNESYVGMYILNYNDRVVVYDYNNNGISGDIPLTTQPQIPQDFVTKLYAHPELVNYKEENPTGSVLDENTLVAYKQQLPQVFNDAVVGDFVLQFSDKIVIYDYTNDRIKGVFTI